MDALLLLFTALPLLLSVSADVKTYKHMIQSGETVVCDRCPPGTHLHAHCTKTRSTECRSCSSGFYTEFWNYIPECLPCYLCVLNQEETQSCTPSQNRACQCREGYYWHEHFCKKHTVCPAGHGIKTKGWPTLIKPRLLKLFKQQKQHRLKHLYHLLSLEGNINSDKTLQHWVSKASEQQLTDLPAKLREANLHSLADHVEQKMKRFQEEAKHCSNSIM